jgi:hypothetical protein
MIEEPNMKQLVAKLTAVAVVLCSICLLTLSTAQAAPDFTWCDRMSALLRGFQASYPTSDFEPYVLKTASLRDATARGDKAALQTEITAVIKMVRPSNIDEEAAVELVNYLYLWRSTLTTPGKYAHSK